MRTIPVPGLKLSLDGHGLDHSGIGEHPCPLPVARPVLKIHVCCICIVHRERTAVHHVHHADSASTRQRHPVVVQKHGLGRGADHERPTVFPWARPYLDCLDTLSNELRPRLTYRESFHGLCIAYIGIQCPIKRLRTRADFQRNGHLDGHLEAEKRRGGCGFLCNLLSSLEPAGGLEPPAC